MADLQLLVQQLTQGQIDLQNHIAALANAQAAPAAVARKKVVADPGTYDGSPAKFHEWWSKIKVWMQVLMQGATDAEVATAVYSWLTGPKAGRWAQVRLDHCMAAAHALAVAPAGHNLPAAWPTEWARAQLLRLRQGPCQRINEFLAQFEALKVQSGCPDEYARDLLKRAISRKILEQVYLQAIARDTYLNLCDSVRDMGRAQELFIINSQGSPHYFQGPYTSSPSSASGSGAPMDIGAANTRPQPCGRGLQCYNCQGFGHIALTPVSSPLSVSSNKYASLVVEDVGTQYTMDCADTTASFVSPSVTVPSTGVPRSGPAPDIKRGVLNSCVLINGQKFPSLASSDSESPADDLEVGFPVELRRTVTMEHEVQILVQV
ncbi:hypothetical protein SCLCIDRAFT_28683 [Scleroderma citrinum Foug A]|uniref:Retrotransposon gag domain-containing protein n=1 Tax=Scleroderma citrinum Foug A TaxID=1036808 RepID=A0A0C3DNJ1_9AGAM|nr:hypothetical protein SCLCIDRAFT_28683 [Scleroderma citrinum Foug A]